jgi:hypothetical protein
MMPAALPSTDDAPPLPKDGKVGGADGQRSGEGADTALEILIRKRKQAELPPDLDLGDCGPPHIPVPPPP